MTYMRYQMSVKIGSTYLDFTNYTRSKKNSVNITLTFTIMLLLFMFWPQEIDNWNLTNDAIT